MDGTTVVTPAPPEVNPYLKIPPGKLIAGYLKLRDRVAEIKKAQQLQIEPFTKLMGQIEASLMLHLETTKTDSAKAKGVGTAFTSTETSVSVKEWSKTLDYIKERGLWDLLEARVSKTAVLTQIEENTAKAEELAKAEEREITPEEASALTVPGVSITQAKVLRVRRS